MIDLKGYDLDTKAGCAQAFAAALGTYRTSARDALRLRALADRERATALLQSQGKNAEQREADAILAAGALITQAKEADLEARVDRLVVDFLVGAIGGRVVVEA